MDEATIREVALHLRDGLDGPGVDPDTLVELLGGRAASAAELFSGIVRALGDDSPVLGEKTPGHARSWELLHRWFPDAKFIAVVRDPRHQIASQRTFAFGTNSVGMAARSWRRTNHRIVTMLERLGPTQAMVVLHDEAVLAPEATRARLATFLGVQSDETRAAPEVAASPHEMEAFGDVDPARAHRRAGDLTPRQAALVVSICRAEMAALGLDPSPSLPGWVGDLAFRVLDTEASRRVWLLTRRARQLGVRGTARRARMRLGGRSVRSR
jgi:hypothetical protein